MIGCLLRIFGSQPEYKFRPCQAISRRTGLATPNSLASTKQGDVKCSDSDLVILVVGGEVLCFCPPQITGECWRDHFQRFGGKRKFRPKFHK
jgi:hypothetical protein